MSLKKCAGVMLLSLALGLCGVYGDVVVYGRAYDHPVGYVLLCLLYACLYFVLIEGGYRVLMKLPAGKSVHLSFLVSFGILMACYLLPLLLKYPAANSMDSYHQLMQGLGEQPLTTHHPVAHTLLLTLFVKGGFFIGNVNVGIFLFVLIETVFLAAVFARSLVFLQEIKAPGWLVVITLLFFGFCPHITGWIGQTTKDVYYSGFFVFFVTELAAFVLLREEVTAKKGFWLRWIAAAAGLTLFRNNGFYVLLLVAAVLFIREVLRLRKNEGNKRMLIALIAVLLVPFVLWKGINAASGAQKGSVAEALSLPLQQTARLVTLHPECVTEEEKAVIEKVLPYEELPALYMEHISDPVKERFTHDAAKGDILRYLGVWLKEFFRAPGTYVAATARQNIYLVYPGYSNFDYYLDSNGGVEGFAMFETPQWIYAFREDYSRFLDVIHIAPVLSLINNMALFVILSFVLGIYGFRRKDRAVLLLLLPVWISELIIIAAPCILGHVRYAFPVIWTLPFYFGILLREKHA